jgi:hypothetical protein
MIPIFCDFRQFSAKKLAFFSKTNVMVKIFHNLALFRVKNAKFFAEFFGENILKIIRHRSPVSNCPFSRCPVSQSHCRAFPAVPRF